MQPPPRQGAHPDSQQTGVTAPLETVQATVRVLVPEFRQVLLETDDGRDLAVTPSTPGIDAATLQPGQVLECVVNTALARVVSARCVG